MSQESAARMDTVDMDVVITTVESAIAKSYEMERRASAPRSNVYASEWRDCQRRMALDVLYSHTLPPHPADTIARMTRGSEREVDLRVRLERAGKIADIPFEVRGAQTRYEYKVGGRVILSMKIDGELWFPNEGWSIPWEGKALSQFIMQRIRGFEDFDKSPWTEHIPYQMLAYLVTANRPTGMMVLDRPGLPMLIPVKLYDHLEKAEDFLRKAQIAVEVADVVRSVESPTLEGIEGLLPAYTNNPQNCERCPMRGVKCFPNHWQQAATVATQEELLEAEEVYWKTKHAAAAYEAAEKTLKAWAKEAVPDLAVVGQSVVKVTERNVSGYTPKPVAPRVDRIVKISRPNVTANDTLEF